MKPTEVTASDAEPGAIYEIKRGGAVIGTTDTLDEAEQAALNCLTPYKDGLSPTVSADIHKNGALVESLSYMTAEDILSELERELAAPA